MSLFYTWKNQNKPLKDALFVLISFSYHVTVCTISLPPFYKYSFLRHTNVLRGQYHCTSLCCNGSEVLPWLPRTVITNNVYDHVGPLTTVITCHNNVAIRGTIYLQRTQLDRSMRRPLQMCSFSDC